MVKVKKCDPFGCKESVVVDQEATSKIRDEKPLGKFNGFGTYIDRNHLAAEQVSEFWEESKSTGEFIGKVGNLPFYKALVFTLTYCVIVTPCVLLLGLWSLNDIY